MSSRYGRDDKEEYRRGRDRSRSRSPRRKPEDSGKHEERHCDRRDEYEYKKREDSRRKEDCRKYDAYKKKLESDTNIDEALEQDSSSASSDNKKSQTYGILSKNKLKSMSIQMKLGGNVSSKPKVTVASAFSQDSDDEPDQMPPEAKMRMRNVGRNTPTSSGPNSFGKTKHGFSDAKKVFERSLKEAMDAARADD